jgi:hypothetical protein
MAFRSEMETSASRQAPSESSGAMVVEAFAQQRSNGNKRQVGMGTLFRTLLEKH